MRTIGNLTISGSLNTSGSIRATTFIGVVSSSAQLSTEISGAFTSTSASLASDIQNNDTRLSTLEGKTLVSSSAQISYTGITDIPNGIVSSSAQLSITESQISDLTHYTNSDTLSYINSIGVVSGSAQITLSSATGNLTAVRISDFDTEVSNNTSVVANTAKVGYTDALVKAKLNTESVLSGSITSAKITDVDAFSQSGTYANLRAQGTTASDVGLGNVTNESKATMFTNAALTGNPTAPTQTGTDDSTKIATTAFVQGRIDTIIGTAGSALDTLGELSASLSNDQDALVSLTTTVGTKLAKSSNLSDLTNVVTARTNLGLGTAATTNSTAYATAAQGTNADTAYSWGDHSLEGYTTCIGDITGVTAGTGLTGGGTSGTVTVSHADTSTLTGAQGSAGIASITVDALGHVTAVTTATYCTTDTNTTYTANEMLTCIKTVDGAGSGLDADTLDGLDSSQFLRSDTSDTFNGTLSVSGNIESSNQISVNNRTAISVAHWSAPSTTTGAIKIQIPGLHIGNYSMLVLRITVYEYNSTAATIYYVSGHDWTSGWYNNGVIKIGNGNKDISLGYDSNYDYIIVGDTSSSWSYGHVTVDVMSHPSFYSSLMDITSGWNITQETSLSGITTQSVINKRVLTTSDEGSGNGLDADLLDGQQGSYYLDYNNFTNKPTIPTNNNQLTNGAGYCTTDTTYTANEMLTCIKTVDGAGSGLDADLLDGNQASAFYLATNPSGYTTCTGTLTGTGTSGYISKWNGSTSQTNSVIYDNGTNVGIGTTNPLSKLQVGTRGTNSALSLGLTDAILFDFYNDNSPFKRHGVIISQAADASESVLDFNTKAANGTNTTKMTILGNGNVGIGTTTPAANLDVNGSGRFNGSLIVNTGNILSLDQNYNVHGYLKFSVTDFGSENSFGMYGYYGLAFQTRQGIGIVLKGNSNNVGIGTTSPSTKLEVNGTATVTTIVETSALRFKENINTIEDTSIIDKLRPVSFDWKDSKETEYGFIAEEVYDLDTTLVTKSGGDELQGIKYTKLIPLLVKKVQEQDKQISKLKNIINGNT
jgi:hypothetical protein